jgi:hypothetical protein
MTDPEDSSAAKLRDAWGEMIRALDEARRAIDDPSLLPAPPSDRNLAEGYRYLMGFVHSAIERSFHADPAFPFLRNVLHLMNKGTIDNADAIYFACPIDGRESYLVRGRVGDCRHWRGEPPVAAGPKAPQYLIFEASAGGLAGDSGSLAELRPGVKAQTGALDSSALAVEADGSFEVLLAPERPTDHVGNFIPTQRARRTKATDATTAEPRHAEWLSGRQLFYDWAREAPIHLSIERLGDGDRVPPPLSVEAAAAALREVGSLTRGQMHFWNQFYTILLETYGKKPGEGGERFMPRNAFNQPNAASSATGGGQSTNIYAGGVYELGPEEALIVESRALVEPQYIGFHLSNLWGESHDFAHHQSSLNGFQAERDPDGGLRWVIAHRDPGVPNWLDTTGHPEGFMAPRWAYSKPPVQADWPTISARKIAFDEIRDALPASTRRVSPEERRAAIDTRRRHVQRRYRVF